MKMNLKLLRAALKMELRAAILETCQRSSRVTSQACAIVTHLVKANHDFQAS